MIRQSNRPAVLRDSWRPEDTPTSNRRWKKRLILLALVVLLAGSIRFFFYLLSEPILHPNTFVVLATGDSSAQSEVGPVQFSTEDLRRLQSLSPFLSQDSQSALDDPIQLMANQELSQIQERIRGLPVHSNDVLVLYISAQGMVIDGNACLISQGFRKGAPGVGNVTVDSLLDVVGQSNSKTVLLVLDSGQHYFDGRLGLVADQFQNHLRESVKNLKRKNVWVLLSNEQGQRSTISEPSQTSVFGYFVRQGLMGKADLDADDIVHLDELYAYVRSKVSHYTQNETSGDGQIPVLIGSPGSNESALLLSVKTVGPFENEVDSEDFESSPNEVDVVDSSKESSPDEDEKVAGSNPESEKPGVLQTEKATSSAESKLTDSEFLFSEKSNKKSLLWNPVLTAEQIQDFQNTWSKIYGAHSQLVKKTWDIFFELESSSNYPMRPFDYSPVAWREIGELISHHDYRIRRNIDRDKSVDRLKEVFSALVAIKDKQRLPAGARFDAAMRIASQRREPMVMANSVVSFANLNELAEQEFCDVSTELREKIQKFKNTLLHQDSLELSKWLSENSDLSGWYEAWLAKRLLETQNVSWDLQRNSILLAMLSGKASDPLVVKIPKLAKRFKQADENRRQAIRLLTEQTATEWMKSGEKLLFESRRQYELGYQETALVRNAFCTRNELLYRLPYYKKIAYTDSRNQIGNFYLELNRLIDATKTLQNALDSLSSKQEISNVLSAVENAIDAQTGFLNILIPDLNDSSNSTLPTRKSLVDLNAALSTPAFGPQFRSRALSILHSRKRLDPTPEPDLMVKPLDEYEPSASPNEFLGYQRQAEVELKIVQLARIQSNDASLMNLEQSLAQSFVNDSDANSKVNRIGALDSLNVRFATFYQTLPKRLALQLDELEDFNSVETQPSELEKLGLLLSKRTLVDPRDIVAAGLFDQNTLLHDYATCFAMMNFQRGQFEMELLEGPASERQFFRKQIESQRLALNEIPKQPKIPQPPTLSLTLVGSQEIRLTNQTQKEVEFECRLTGNEAQPIWLVFDYDDEKLAVTPTSIDRAINQNEIRKQNGNLIPIQAIAELVRSNDGQTKTPPTFIAQPGETKRFKFLITNTSNASDSNLFLTVIDPKQMSRHRTRIQLPSRSDWDLHLDSVFSNRSERGSSITLSPLPNQTLDYNLAIQNLSGRKRKVQLELHTPLEYVRSLPPSGNVTAEELQEFFHILGSSKKIYQLPLEVEEAGSIQPISLMSEEAKKKQKEGGDKKEEESSDPVRHGLVFVLTDIETQLSRIWVVNFRPQMPRRFVKAFAKYDSVSERIEIVIEKLDDHRIPIGGHTVVCEFANKLTRGTESLLRGTISDKISKLNLFAHVPRSINRKEKIFVHVDGYPRAFVFNVPCWSSSDRISESKSEMRFSIDTPVEGSGFKAPIEKIPIEFKVDAPVGAFVDSNDHLLIGIDVDRDRELNDEQSVRLTSDRQADVFLIGMGNHSGLRIKNSVGDFKVNLPGSGYRNSRLNLLGKLKIGSRTEWSNPREVWLDAEAPELVKVTMEPSSGVSQKEKLKFKIYADDDQMSGVEKVIVGFADFSGLKFDEKIPPVEAKQDADKSWIAELPMEKASLGVQTLLISAVDKVGNQSKPKAIKINVLSEEEKTDQAKRFTLEGTIRYFKSPQSGVEIVLVAEDGSMKTTRSLDDGSFVLKELPAGKFKLKARAVIRNTPRIALKDVVVSPENENNELNIILK